MVNWVTYLRITLNPTSADPEQVVKKLTKLGWKPVYGDYDFAWEWENGWEPNGYNKTFWENLDKAYKVLQTVAVDFSFRTYEKGKESGRVWS